MVPALFFKYTGTFVDWDAVKQAVVLNRDNQILTLPLGKPIDDLPITTVNYPTGTFIPLQYAAEKLGMKVSYNFKLSRTHIVTNTPPSSIPRIYYKAEINQKKVALTFDDGPDHFYTPRILDILKSKRVQATFFVVGTQVALFPQMLKRIVQEGHALGNHSWSHPHLPQLTTSQVLQQVQKAERLVQSVAEVKTNLFRPPYGQITNADLRLLGNYGYRTIMWSVNTLDWTGISEQEILPIVKRDVTPGAIILQHGLLTVPGILNGTVKALPEVIDYLRNRGYEFVTVQDFKFG